MQHWSDVWHWLYRLAAPEIASLSPLASTSSPSLADTNYIRALDCTQSYPGSKLLKERGISTLDSRKRIGFGISLERFAPQWTVQVALRKINSWRSSSVTACEGSQGLQPPCHSCCKPFLPTQITNQQLKDRCSDLHVQGLSIPTKLRKSSTYQ